jgi:hypothetical protein
MNRIVIIGNGFDLAHGLETSYRNFIDDLWEREKNGFITRNFSYCHDYYKSESTFIEVHSTRPHMSKITTVGYGYDWFENLRKNCGLLLVAIKNTFLDIISKEIKLQNWVDIEKEYYRELNECLDNKRKGGIKKLNAEFSAITTALKIYLEDLQKHVSSENKIFQHLKINEKSIDNMIFLNFNYTSIIKNYGVSEEQIIYIHGKLNDSNNPIIFGYGDEQDENYKLIENKDDNEYFKKTKTIDYLKTDNYKKMRTFMESGEYEIFIMGHSCGISDRTLLNRLFEHKNCQSIRVFYHKKDDGSDNYDDIMYNIYRIFNDKNTMVDKVVSKDNCVPLL